MMTEDKNMEQVILEAAEELFLEQGFASTTTSQIAQKAGCNKALVHYYYRTKDRLFETIFEGKIKILIGSLVNAKNEGTTFEEKLTMMISRQFDFFMENSKLPLFLCNEITAHPERIKSIKEKIQDIPLNLFKGINKELQEEIEKGNIRPISIIDLLVSIISLNIIPFILKPIAQAVLEMNEQQVKIILEKRKEETIQTILARLKP
jgi:AcrR family transcriptional regulator